MYKNPRYRRYSIQPRTIYRSKIQTKLKMTTDGRVRNNRYRDIAKTTKARNQKSHVFTNNNISRNVTPSKRSNDGSYYINFKLFDSTVINESKVFNESGKSHDILTLLKDDQVKLPNIKHQASKLDKRIELYSSNYRNNDDHN